MEHDQLFTEFNIRAARQISLSTEVRMCIECNIWEKRRLKSVVDEQAELLKVREKEIEDLKTKLLLKEAEAAEAIRIHSEVSKFKVVEKSLRDKAQVLKECNTTLESEKGELEVKVADLTASVKVREQEVADLDDVVTFVRSKNDNLVDQVHGLETSFTKLQEKMALHLEKIFYPHLLTTIFGRQWLLTHDMELVIAKCLNSTKYLSTLGVAIGKAIEKEADYLSALQYTLAEKLGLIEWKPHVDQLMVPIHHCPDQRVIGASALSLSLDVSSFRVQKIKENIADQRSALRDVFVPLSEPLLVTALTGTEGTSNLIPATADTTMALSVTFASASFIPLISSDDYEVVHADGREGTGADANPFPNVDDAKLNIS
ncbi:hypothetical protein Tco_0821659 [Tanacetum coccineum]|uniref:Uncharacterized protein n=1 Tax=Tanacetum coccineum TaxID=301880 RepID=A0ABQ5ACV3_9ASTR